MFIKKSIHEKINYSGFSKTRARAVCCAIYLMKAQAKLLVHKTWHYEILGIFLKDKDMKEVLSVMDIITTFSTE